MLRIALAQINTTVGDLTGNRTKILANVDRARSAGADLVIFPEMAVSGYPPEDLLHKDHFVQDNIKSLQTLAKDVTDIAAIVGFVDRDAKKNLYNAAAVMAKGRVQGVYHKQDLPNYGVFDEKRYFTPGVQNPLFSLNGILLGVNICEDIWIEEGVHKGQAKRGAKVLVNISSSPYDFGKIQQRQRLLMNRAKATKAFVCYVNLAGGQDELVFDGGSLILNPQGRIVASGKPFAEDLVVVDLPVKPARQKKSKTIIALPGRKDENREPLKKHLYPQGQQNERIFKALVLGTRDYIQKNGFQKVVIGVSGGIDSSLVAVIAREAVGKDNVIGISMPSPFTSSGTQADARQLAENLGIRFIEIPIAEIFAGYLAVFEKEFAGRAQNVAEENLQARIRGNILMAFSNKFGWLVLTTGNKSEVAVGYCTLYGDMTGGFAVIKDLPKTKVYELARLVNEQKGGLIPESVLERAPTAELRENQRDEDSLPAYKVLDPLLKAYVEDHQSLAKMAKLNKDVDLIKDVIKKVDGSEYKRRQSPPGIKITSRAFGKDWRLPITNKYKEF